MMAGQPMARLATIGFDAALAATTLAILVVVLVVAICVEQRAEGTSS